MLIVSEFGVVGLILGCIITNNQITRNKQLSITKLQETNKNKLVILGIILVAGMVDHYWLTLPQNSWLLCVVLALI